MKLFHTLSHAILALFIASITTACGGGSEPSTQEAPVLQNPTKKEQTSVTQIPSEIKSLLAKNTCLGCHKMDSKLIGPSFLSIAQKGYTQKKLVQLIKEPVPENWPDYPPMAPMAWIEDEQLEAMSSWIASLPQE
jgi:cytochrome c551/c552